MADLDISTVFIPALHKPSALLPIAKHRETLLYMVETYPVTVVVGQTGSGKSTQIPQYLDKAGWCADGKIIGITQPRRVAATTVAARVAEEVGCEVGKEIGYSIRFEDVTSADTRIKFLTDGLLIQEALVDPLLSRYSVIMIDEAHERSISSDILLGLLKKICKQRHDLRIIISSATLQAETFRDFFSKSGDSAELEGKHDASPIASIISLEGRAYAIDVLYLEAPAEDYLEKAIATVFDIHENEPTGDILVFLTGRDEIDQAVQAISERSEQLPPGSKSILPLPLYAGLSTEQQMYVFEEAPVNYRKVIFSTNIAEASVTIDGIVYVIDCGFVKLRAYDPRTGIDSLTATPVSRASAAQRAGRAGRTRPGKCFRLYTEEAYQALPDANVPEIQRSNLAPFILQLKALGIDNVLRFDFITPPSAELMIRGLELLYSLGALDDYAKLTKPLGMRMAELAVEPMMAKTLLVAPSFGCLGEILTIAAMTSLGGAVFIQHEGEKNRAESAKRKFAAEEGDHLTLLNVYQAFVTKGRRESRFCHENLINFNAMTRAVSIRGQLKRYLERFGLVVDDSPALKPGSTNNENKSEQIQRCLTAGYFAHAARMQPDGTFRNISGSTVLHAHPSSLMFNRKADWVIFHEVMETGDKTFIRDVTKIEKSWLLEYAPEFYKTSR
ncbi:P-loop containing nucleoside triphosphate hydrolase protein [Apodospora peruviana]|uniref:RNA helicase n=1 Tax=Apodospora peruviana TaxID=516989 RepID=A0AAE0HY21_9PEZI|nr:P-loop containing nucleoside triphosphate hydrolase protein [Apodospora peruviana]